ncbi:MAG: zf-TFIIB domain-containing protein [Deltaproteobacteria bacterium]|nr:zf-TFIIB domain-containing protein [Deltaproteobacteria bacterium]
MTNAWDDMKRAKEDSYFEKKNKEALNRLSNKQQQSRLSPITGKPMEQVVIHGVVIDRCQDTGGIWLDAGELEQLVEASKNEKTEASKGESLLASFLKTLSGKS